MTMRTPHFRRAAGFTLVEAIVVIVITGIVASFVAVFIRLPVQSYVDTTARIALADAADTALSRINRELRLALPNSVVPSADYTAIQFVLTKAGGRYLDVTNQPPATLQPLQFNVANPSFDMIGPAPTGRAAILPGNLIVLTNTPTAPANVYATNRNNVATVTSVTTNAGVTRIALNGTLGTSSPSPFRFRVVEGTVTYICQGNQLVRYFTPTIPTTGFAVAGLGTPSLMANRAQCVFKSVVLPTQAGTSLVTAALTLASPAGESVALVRQTQVENLQ